MQQSEGAQVAFTLSIEAYYFVMANNKKILVFELEI
jgi:hypothetical protein